MSGKTVVRFVVAVLVVSACSSSDVASTFVPEQTSTTTVGETTTSQPASEVSTTIQAEREPELICPPGPSGEIRVDDAETLPDPADDLEANLPAGTDYYQWSTRDGPETDFAPCFHRASHASFEDHWIVIGVVIDGDARAYLPDQLIAHVVNDHIGGVPALVTY